MNVPLLFGLFAALFLILFIPVAPVQWVGAFFLLVILSSKLYSVVARRSIGVERRRSSVYAFKYRAAAVELIVTNRGRLPIPYVALVDDSSGLAISEQNRAVISLRARERTLFQYELKGYNRGVYSVGPVTLRGADPLGLFPWRRTYPLPAEFVVYPSIRAVAVAAQIGVPSGSVRVWNPVYEDITNYRSLREYVPGDDPRRIDWKVSARTGSLQTVQYLPAVSFTVMILVDLNTSHFALRNRYQHTERVIEAAASLVASVIGLGQPVGLLVTGGIGKPAPFVGAAPELNGQVLSPELPGGGQSIVGIPVGSGDAHAVEALALLSRVVAVALPAEQGPVEAFTSGGARLPPGSRVFYVGPALDQARQVLLARSVDRRGVELYFVDEGETRSAAVSVVLPLRWITAAGEKILE